MSDLEDGRSIDSIDVDKFPLIFFSLLSIRIALRRMRKGIICSTRVRGQYRKYPITWRKSKSEVGENDFNFTLVAGGTGTVFTVWFSKSTQQ